MNEKITHDCLEQVNNCLKISYFKFKFSEGGFWEIEFDTDDGEGEIKREISYCPYCGKHLGEII